MWLNESWGSALKITKVQQLTVYEWDLSRAPIYLTPEDQRMRVAQRVDAEATYERHDGATVTMRAPHYIVWPKLQVGEQGGEPVGVGSPAYITAQGYADGFGDVRPLSGGMHLTEKLNGRRAALYLGPDVRVATNENDPADPASWPILRAGDWIAVSVNKHGTVQTTGWLDGNDRNDQYPVRAEEFSFLPEDADETTAVLHVRGKQVRVQTIGGRVPTTTGPDDGVLHRSVAEVDSALRQLDLAAPVAHLRKRSVRRASSDSASPREDQASLPDQAAPDMPGKPASTKGQLRDPGSFRF